MSKSVNKVTVVIGLSKNLEDNFDAVDLIRLVTPIF